MEPSQPWGPGQAWIKLKTDSMEDKVSDQSKPVEPVQKLLPQVDEEDLLKAQKGECWWKMWVKVRRPSQREGGREGLGPGLQELFHPLSCLQTKWNLREFQAEKHPGEGALSPFFRFHTSLDFKDYLLKFIRVAAFHPSYLYIQYIPLPSPPALFSLLLHPSFPVCTLKLLILYLSFPISSLLPWFSFSLSVLNL